MYIIKIFYTSKFNDRNILYCVKAMFALFIMQTALLYSKGTWEERLTLSFTKVADSIVCLPPHLKRSLFLFCLYPFWLCALCESNSHIHSTFTVYQFTVPISPFLLSFIYFRKSFSLSIIFINYNFWLSFIYVITLIKFVMLTFKVKFS